MRTLPTGLLALTLVSGFAASAYPQISRHGLEVRGGVAIPAFDFADVSKPGPAFGLGYQFHPTGNWLVMFDADYSSQPADDDGLKVTIYHFLGKLGIDLVDRASPWSFILNAGAGLLLFDFEQEIFGTKRYFGTNFGAKVGYAPTERVTVYANVQADVAFSESSGLIPTSNAWVWPVTLGLAYRP
ncbi:MAG: hypothetical protein AMS18_10875 [Gemmatimonas sp. SG8_17]|nr:MAG: hypothetical protein AMS18_10875 [Gemmatimonas sp. SG8_17]